MTEDTATCTVTSECKTTTNGTTTTTVAAMKTSASSITGTVSMKTVQDSNGTVLYDCTYDMTATKQ